MHLYPFKLAGHLTITERKSFFGIAFDKTQTFSVSPSHLTLDKWSALLKRLIEREEQWASRQSDLEYLHSLYLSHWEENQKLQS